ncbi:hypothetical protein PanWU01x14_290530 [Parasponia andersonii]|uniref:Ankyrin repeat-containing domain containing protein n=1 Tax=Parasponia andersonii TaxID=3476 RepID=A0A2P5AXS5_PARAD|nr:hypothetical protein PanWU01x14_290530 [Parasponia andersonii]
MKLATQLSTIYASLAGSPRATVALISKRPTFTNIGDDEGRTPLLVAVKLGSKIRDLMWYLTLKTTDEEPSRPFTGPHAGDLVIRLAASGYVGKREHIA